MGMRRFKKGGLVAKPKTEAFLGVRRVCANEQKKHCSFWWKYARHFGLTEWPAFMYEYDICICIRSMGINPAALRTIPPEEPPSLDLCIPTHPVLYRPQTIQLSWPTRLFFWLLCCSFCALACLLLVLLFSLIVFWKGNIYYIHTGVCAGGVRRIYIVLFNANMIKLWGCAPGYAPYIYIYIYSPKQRFPKYF